MERLSLIAIMIHDARWLLDEAGRINSHDGHAWRRAWISFEILKLRIGLKVTQEISLHLPNFCLAEEIFRFAVDESIAVVEVAVSIPIIVIHEAIHLIHRVFHFMKVALKWTVETIIHEFFRLVRKIKRGFQAVGRGIHRIAHGIKEGLEDGASIIMDVGHHVREHFRSHNAHHDHEDCHNRGTCDDELVEEVEEGDSCTFDGQCTEEEECIFNGQCTKEEFTMKASAKFDISVSWTKEEAQTKVVECMRGINSSLEMLQVDIKTLETDTVDGVSLPRIVQEEA